MANFAFAGEYDRRNEAYRASSEARMRAAEENYYARIHAKIEAALSERFQVAFYASGKDFLGGGYACAVNTLVGIAISCFDSQNQPVSGLSRNDLLRALGCKDFTSYFVGGDTSNACRRDRPPLLTGR